jgi:hypothetical protein
MKNDYYWHVPIEPHIAERKDLNRTALDSGYFSSSETSGG